MQAVEKQTEYDQIEKQVVEQLGRYNTITGRIKILNKQPIGNGMHIDVAPGEDKLQALHKALEGLPTHMYLTAREQRIEQTANSYITDHPAGISSQLREVRLKRPDEDDAALLKELARKMRKIINARGGSIDGFEAMLQRVSEIQDLQQEKDTIDDVLSTMEVYKPKYALLLRRLYIDEEKTEVVSREMNTHRVNLNKWRKKAIMEYAKLAGLQNGYTQAT